MEELNKHINYVWSILSDINKLNTEILSNELIYEKYNIEKDIYMNYEVILK